MRDRVPAEQEILLHCPPSEDPFPFGDVGDTAARAGKSRQLGDVVAFEPNGTSQQLVQAGYRAQGCGLARSVWPHQESRPALVDGEGYIPNRPQVSVATGQVLYLEERFSAHRGPPMGF